MKNFKITWSRLKVNDGDQGSCFPTIQDSFAIYWTRWAWNSRFELNFNFHIVHWKFV